MGSRKKQKRRNQKKRSQQLKTRFPPPKFLGRGGIAVLRGSETKMSEVLVEFLEPYSEHWKTEEELRKLLTLALVAWNAALFSGSKRSDFIQRMAQSFPPESRQDFHSIIQEMIKRKEAHFASNKRTILDYQVTMTPSGPHLVVLSTLDTA